MAVITIARQFGAGARVVGKMVAEDLHLGYVDKQLIAEAAQRLGANPNVLAALDERPEPFRTRISRMLQTFLEKSAATGATGDPFLGPSGMEILLSRSYCDSTAPAVTEGEVIDDRRFLSITRAVITDLAAAGNVVIIGRGSQLILKDKPNALRVYLVAPLEVRIQRIMEMEALPRKVAERLAVETDRQRDAFIRKFFKANMADPMLYHLVINTGLVSLEQAARLIGHAARIMELTPV